MALLLEAPEPMSDASGRLIVEVGDAGSTLDRGTLIANADYTRIFVMPTDPVHWPKTRRVTYQLTWLGRPGEDARAWRRVNGADATFEKSSEWEF